MLEENPKSLSIGDCPSPELLQKYLMQTLDERERHALERHAIGCELCSDAIDGYATSGNSNVIAENKILKKRLNGFFNNSKRKIEKIAVWASAASVVLIIGATLMFFFSSHNQKESTLISLEQSSQALAPPIILKNNEEEIASLPPSPEKLIKSEEATPGEYLRENNATAKIAEKEKAETIALEENENSDKKLNAGNVNLATPSATSIADNEQSSDITNMDEIKIEMIAIAENQASLLEQKENRLFLKKSASVSSEKNKSKSRKSSTTLKALADSTSIVGVNKPADDGYLHAIETYNRKDFRHSAELFEILVKKDAQNFKYLLYAILSEIQDGDTKNAIKNITRMEDNSLEEASYKKWLEALTQLTKDPGNAQLLLREIAEGKSDFRIEAARLMQNFK